MVFFIYYLILGQISPNWFAWIFVPIEIIHLGILGLGVGIIISSLTTKYRDLSILVGFGVSLWSYSSPVAYDMFSREQLMNGIIYNIYMLNPVTPAINLFRYGFLGTGEVDWLFYGISWITTALVVVIGALMFSKSEKTFMDTV
jgi:lipopolysaccharide transport system permease protein